MNKIKLNQLIKVIRSLSKRTTFPLHDPCFDGNEKKYLNECIDSTFVSSVGKYVDLFEQKIKEFTKSKYAIATVNGTTALHISLIAHNVLPNDEIITSPLTFVATTSAIKHCYANPIFVDIEEDTLSINPEKLLDFLKKNTISKNGLCINKISGGVIKGIISTNVFGHPGKLDVLRKIAKKHNLFFIEDAAESLGSFYKNKHTGLYGDIGVISFNGNKIVTTGSGGIVLTQSKKIYLKIKHLSTTAKISHPWEFIHDQIGYNYRMPNVCAAIGLAQMENIDKFLLYKRNLTSKYKRLFSNFDDFELFEEPCNSRSNFWLQALILKSNNIKNRDFILKELNNAKIYARPVWRPMHLLKPYSNCLKMNLDVTEKMYKKIINIPSSAYLGN